MRSELSGRPKRLKPSRDTAKVQGRTLLKKNAVLLWNKIYLTYLLTSHTFATEKG